MMLRPFSMIAPARALSMLTAALAVSLLAASAASPLSEAPRRPPKGFELLSRSLVEGPSRAVCFFDDGIIVGTGGGIALFPDGGALRNPAYIGIDGEPYEIVVREGIAYVAANMGGLRAIDISDRAHPKEIFKYQTSQATGCACAGNTLFLADANGRLFTFALDDPREPRLKETTSLPFPAVSLSADGTTLAVVDAKKTRVCRVLPDGALEPRCEVKAPSNVSKGVLSGGVLYLLTETGEVVCWNVAREKTPSALQALQIKNVIDIAVSGDRGLLLTRLGFVVPFDLERMVRPGGGASGPTLSMGRAFNAKAIQETERSADRGAKEASPLQSTSPESQLITGIFMSGKRFALVSAVDAVRLCELDGPGARFLDRFPTRGFAIDLIAEQGYLYVANSDDGVRIGKVERDGAVDWVGHLQTYEARDVALVGHNLVIADGQGGLKIADVTDPRNPKIIGSHSSPYYMSALVVASGKAYCAGGMGGVEIVDIADVHRPKLLWRQDFSEVRGIWVEGPYLHFADGFEGYRIFSLAGKKPVQLAVLNMPGWTCDCFVSKNMAYLADGGRGIAVVDVKDKRRPRLFGSVSVGSIAREIHLRRRTLFVASNTSGITAVDVSSPRNPSITASYQTVSEARGVFADDEFVYLASGSGGVYVFKYHE